jgi:carboxymethylenebutenolidase
MRAGRSPAAALHRPWIGGKLDPPQRHAQEQEVTANSKWIDIPTQGGTFQGYLSLPPAGKGPGIVLLQEAFGVNSHIREVADQYALDGYVVLAPDMYWRTEPHLELGYEGADRDKGIATLKATDIPSAVADIGAAAKILRALPAFTGKLATIGYCFGGRLAYLAAAAGLVDVAVAYYGGGIQNQLDLADKVTVPILFNYGEKDSGIPLEAVEQVKERFAGRGNAQFHVYPGAEHGFNCWQRGSYHPHASALAHGHTLVFLGEHL